MPENRVNASSTAFFNNCYFVLLLEKASASPKKRVRQAVQTTGKLWPGNSG